MHWSRATANTGYCPQFDAVVGEFKCRQLLRLFARIRGVQSNELDRCADLVLQAVGLTMYSGRKVKALSGGCKRRLSLALALIGWLARF